MSAAKDEVLIIGGGPAGLAAGIALRYQGVPCTVIDARRPPIDKACGEGLMPDALLSLARLGIQLTPADGAVFTGIRFIDEAGSVSAAFPHGVGIGTRRTRLHELMVAHAERMGVVLRWNSRAQLQASGSVLVDGERLPYRFLIGADGQSSAVRAWAGLDRASKLEIRYGFRCHFGIKPWSQQVEVHWADCGQIYVTPVGSQEVCLALVTRDPTLRLTEALPSFAQLKQRVGNARPLSDERGAVSATRKLHAVVRGAVALIGDASGSPDAVTGEGMALAFRQAVALAAAIKCGNLSQYSEAHEHIARLPLSMSAMLLLMDRYPAARRHAFEIMREQPDSFANLLSVHVGNQSLPQFIIRQGPALGWHILSQGLHTLTQGGQR